MTVETTLEVHYGNEDYILLVKMIRIEASSYFFIRDKENEKSLLSGKTLELTWLESFSLTEFGGKLKSPGIPRKITTAVQKELMKNRQNWF